jgi:SNF2 family DNA or RNA helicase
VGSGKSFAVLALVLATRNAPLRKDPIVRAYASNRVVLCMRDTTRPVNATLLVVPHTLCAQWEDYVVRFGSSLRYRIVSRAKHAAALGRAEIEAADLIVVTSSFYNSVVAVLNMHRLKVRRCVYDEADALAIASCQPASALFTWFVTASYGNLVHPRGCLSSAVGGGNDASHHTGVRGTGYIKALFTDLHPDVARVLVVKNRDGFVARSMQLPEPIVQHVRCATPMSIRVLRGVVDDSIIRCLSAGDVASALQHVQASNRGSEDNIVSLLLGKLQRQLRVLDSRIAVESAVEVESEAERDSELSRLRRRRDDLEARMRLVRERIVGCDTCCICYDDIVNKAVLPCCSNAFCFTCVSKWLTLNQQCPLCKAPALPSRLLLVEADGPGGDHDALDRPKVLDKLQHLERIVTADGAKCLVFSSFENTFDEVVAMLDRVGVRHRSLKGNQATVGSIVDGYKRRGDVDVLLVNTHNYGSGLNLENTTDIVLMHRLDGEIERQVVGRATRWGRSAPLRVWHLLYENEARDLRQRQESGPGV